ncbi:MAG: 1-deoxy-D-xylulose-5-phosphate reductoisomerase [Lachnospiraceae bacterium]|nr:1-deoxy-D-xylulose-5-phosphate reductoisomerase [Lachnospiraceae bacterium]
MKKIGILGSTGSIGTQTLDIVRNNPADLSVTALAAGSNINLLEAQIREFRPQYAAMWNEEAANELRIKVADTPVKILSGMAGLIEVSTVPEIEMLVTAIVGMIGLRPTIEAIKAGKDIALANKETLVTAGHLIMPLVKKKGIKFLPVDSEHSAIFQSLASAKHDTIKQIILTASGGPFRGKSAHELAGQTKADALRHPNWTMGQKITIDSATLVNKGLEVIEAYWLFGVTAEQIKVIIHPQSIIHSMVEFIDRGIMAQLGTPDMKLPIQYALFYPERKPLQGESVDFLAAKALTFEEPDLDTFKGLPLAFSALAAGGSMPCVYNAANEKAVSLFLEEKIGFLQIYELIAGGMAKHKVILNPSVEDILAAELETYNYINEKLMRKV